jgi:hypothetical protein
MMFKLVIRFFLQHFVSIWVFSIGIAQSSGVGNNEGKDGIDKIAYHIDNNYSIWVQIELNIDRACIENLKQTTNLILI